MKQTIRFKTSDQSSLYSNGLVMSEKGDHQRIRIISMYEKQFLIKPSMEKPENDLSPRPYAVPGFRGGSCCQANLPDNNRTPVESTAKGRRFKTQSGYGFLPWNHAMIKTPLHAKLNGNNNAFAGNPAMMILHPEMMLPRVHDFLVMADFQKQTAWRIIDPENVQIVALNADLSNHTPCGGMAGIIHSKTTKTSCKLANTHFLLIAAMHLNFQIVSKTPFRRLKTWHTKLHFDSISGQEYSGKAVTKKCDLLIND